MKFDKYDSISPDYHYRQINWRSFRLYNASVHARFLALLNRVREASGKRPLKLLDVGCGDGVALSLIAQSLPNIELSGVDEVESALDVVRVKVPKATVLSASAYSLPFDNESFDIVISSDVIEHVDDPHKMLSEIKRVAKDDARIIIGTPVRRTKHPIDPHHVQEFFTEDFMELISSLFRNASLHESHNLITTLLYNAPTKTFLNWRYVINLISILGLNPFLRERRNKSQMFAYMYVICRK